MSAVLGVIVSYHPTLDLIENMKLLLAQVAHVVVVDNESSPESQKLLAPMASERLSVLINRENHGVALGFNQGIRWGLENSYDYFLLMDQDSQAQAGMVDALVVAAEDSKRLRQLVLVGPRHEDFVRKIITISNEPLEAAALLITSGSLLSKQLIEKVGLYDEKLFIDHVDHDYCLRVYKHGGKCLKVNSGLLLHKFGEAKVRKFLGMSFFLQEYSPFRRYHMMRNRIVLYKRYGMFRGDWFWLDLRSAAKDLVKLVFFESDKSSKLLALFRGLIDGLRWQD